MNRKLLLGFVAVLTLCQAPAFAGPRDYAAVLNRCGKPLRGEETILEDTVAGGRRILSYERGELRLRQGSQPGMDVQPTGSIGKKDHLDANVMEKYMPCLKDALAESSSPEPLVTITPVQRVEVSVKRDYKVIVLYTLLGLVVVWADFSHPVPKTTGSGGHRELTDRFTPA